MYSYNQTANFNLSAAKTEHFDAKN